MMRTIRRASYALVFAAAFATLAAPAAAQTGGVRGKVTDPSGQPVEGAQVVIQSKDSSRKHELKTDKKGEFVQIGIFPGEYTITVTKDVLKNSIDTRVGLGDPGGVEIRLQQTGPTEEQKKKGAELQQLFEAGVASTRAENYDEAIAKFEQAIAIAPMCADCYYNIGYAHARKNDLDKAAAAFEKAAELRPAHADTWSSLANIYNQQGKGDKAIEASNKALEAAGAAGGAGTGGNASALFNQGVILWNQKKYPEAKEKFEAAAKADPAHADTQFMLGMSFLNVDGDVTKAVAAFEAYLKAAPDGKNAEKAKQFIADLKQ